MKEEEIRKEMLELLSRYQTFGSVEDENFTPVGYFDDRASWYQFQDEIVDLIVKHSKAQ